MFNKHKKQLKAVFDWLSAATGQNEIILLERENKQEAYCFKFPLKFGDKPKKLGNFDKNNVSFLTKFSSHISQPGNNDWCLIFSSPEIEIFENKKRVLQSQLNPLYRGISEEGKREILNLARRSLELFLAEGTRLKMDSPDARLDFYNSRTDLNVALWTKGALRGFYTLEGSMLIEGIINASISAAQNPGFKPLSANELVDTKIEITLISDLKIPLSKDLIKKNEIFYDKGYLLKKGGRKNWFLPALFNIKRFRDLKDFIVELSPEKKIDEEAEIFIFEVEDFIEGEKKDEILALNGPIIRTGMPDGGVKQIACLAAEWLLKVQEPDGNFIPIINPLTGAKTQVDWSRSGLIAWSLVEFSKTIDGAAYFEAGERTFFYLKKYLLDNSTIVDGFDSALISLAFLGETALSLGYWQESSEAGSKILRKGAGAKFEPVSFCQAGSFLANLAKKEARFFEPAWRLANLLESEFKNNLKGKKPMSLPAWAGLADLFLRIFEITDDYSSLTKAKEIVDWLLSNQLECGAFKSTNDSNFTHVRATGKVIEILAHVFTLGNKKIDAAFDFTYHKNCLKKAFAWLGEMQYSSQNSYFVPRENLDLVMGGLRHDYFNPELWIDSAGHLILGASRFLKADF